MERTGKKVSTASLEAKNEKQKEALAKFKAKYEADNAEMLRFVKLRDSMLTEELMDAIPKANILQ